MALCLAIAAGCAAPPPLVTDIQAAKLAQTPYPWGASVGDLDIVASRQGPDLVLTNRTATTHEGVPIWLNQEYVCQPASIPIGVETRLELASFINRHGEPFPVGGFLTPDKTLPIVLVELYITPPRHMADAPKTTAHRRYRLLVRTDNQPLTIGAGE